MANFTLNNDLVERLQTAAEQADCSVDEILTLLLDQQPVQRLSADFQQYLKAIHRAGMALDQVDTLNENMLSIQGISHDLRLALSCLMDNAIRYSPEDGSIVIESRLGVNKKVVLWVIDTGPKETSRN